MKYLPLRIVESLLSIFLIIGCASIYVHGDEIIKSAINIGVFLLIILLSCISFYLLSVEHKLTYKWLVLWFSYFIFFLIPFTLLNNLNYPMGNFFVLQFSLLPGLVFYFQFCRTVGNPRALMLKIDKFINVVAIISLIFWILFSILHISLPTGTIVIDWGPRRLIPSFYGIYFETQPVNFYGLSIIRNTAFFTEGPMYAFILSISLISRIFLFNKSIKSSFLIILTMLTTVTSTSLVVIGLTLFFKYLKDGKRPSVNTFKKILLPFVSIILLIFVAFILEQKTKGGESFGIRMDDIHAAFLTWKSHPFVGNGIGNFQSLINNMNSFRIQFKSPIEIGFSSGLFQVFALGGIFLTIIYIYPFVAFSVRQYKQIGIFSIAFPIILLIIFTFSIISYEWLFLIILAMLYTNSLRN